MVSAPNHRRNTQTGSQHSTGDSPISFKIAYLYSRPLSLTSVLVSAGGGLPASLDVDYSLVQSGNWKQSVESPSMVQVFGEPAN